MGSEADPPLVEVIKKKPGQRFASVRRGVDPAQVDAFLVKIASRIDALETKLHQEPAEVSPEGEDVARVPAPAPAEDTSDGYTKRMARLGDVGEREVKRMLAEAKEEAATIAAEAKSEADRIRSDAKSEARRSVDEAGTFLTQVEDDASRMLSDLAERRRQMIEDIRRMQERLLAIAGDIDLAINPEDRGAGGSGSPSSAETGAP